MSFLTDDVIDWLLVDVPDSPPQRVQRVRDRLIAIRDMYRSVINFYCDEVSDLHKRIDALTNYDYEARIEELESEWARVDGERVDWLLKYRDLEQGLRDLLEH